MSGRPSTYAGKVAIRHAIEAAKASGLNVAGLEMLPNGMIRILDARAVSLEAPDEFEHLRRDGLL